MAIPGASPPVAVAVAPSHAVSALLSPSPSPILAPVPVPVLQPVLEGPSIPALLVEGVPMLKVSSKKIKQVIVHLSRQAITWPSLKGGRVDIRSIRELRLGQPPTDAYSGSRWITIVYVRANQWKVVHLIAHTDDVYQLWVDALQDVVSDSSDRVVAQVPASDPDLLFIRQLWPRGATTVDTPTAVSLCAQLGLVVTPAMAAKYENPLDVATFRQLVRAVQTRPELDNLFQMLGGAMDRDAVRVFLRESQKITEDVFDRYSEGSVWTSDSLANFLSSSDNTPHYAVDYSYPLSDYFIASSHNTYLVAEQWRGESTVEGYIRVLLAGCRCVEIDCHNGDIEPVVYHAKSLTSSVPVRDVCRAISKYAFVASPYPLIISLEIRCSVEQQDRLCNVLADVFGDSLVTDLLPGIQGLPSPEDLKNRILIKAKLDLEPTAPSSPTSPLPLDSDSTNETTPSATESDSSLIRLARRLSLSKSTTDRHRLERHTAPRSPPFSRSPPSFSRRLADLVVYTTGVRYRGFSKLVRYEFQHLISVSERTANRILRDSKADWIKHNFTHLSRVYPKGIRVSSSNFDPRPYWEAGCQMVALNYQTLDEGTLLNNALFDSGGYVLKPLALRQKSSEPPQLFRVNIRIISAQRLPLTADLHVEAKVQGAVARTRIFRTPTLNPLWNETLTFDVDTTAASLLDLAFVQLEIKSKNNVVAQWIRPMAQTPRGYRYLPLYDSLWSRYLFATLFVRIDVDPI